MHVLSAKQPVVLAQAFSGNKENKLEYRVMPVRVLLMGKKHDRKEVEDNFPPRY